MTHRSGRPASDGPGGHNVDPQRVPVLLAFGDVVCDLTALAFGNLVASITVTNPADSSTHVFNVACSPRYILVADPAAPNLFLQGTVSDRPNVGRVLNLNLHTTNAAGLHSYGFPGGAAFAQAAIALFELSGPLQAFEAVWYPGGTNYQQFCEGCQQRGLTPTQAARETWSGVHVAQAYGFTEVEQPTWEADAYRVVFRRPS